MKILNLTEFRKLPEGTVFQKYEPQVFGNLQVFGGICGEEDFISADITAWPECSGSNEMDDILTKAEQDGISFDLDTECYGRDALYEDAQLFAVYENKDILQLIETLKKGIF